jgi:hypothetical protein
VEGARYNIRANAIAPLALTRMTEDIMGRLGEKLSASLVSPIVTYLAHESCEATGRLFSVGGGRVAEVFIAEVPGFYKEDLTAEDVAENWASVTEREGYAVPTNLGEETGLFVKAFKA